MSEEQSCKNCIFGQDDGCPYNECMYHPQQVIPCLWEPVDGWESSVLESSVLE